MRRRNGRPGLLGTMARTAVIAGTATAVSGNVREKQMAGAAQAQGAAPQPPTDAPAPAGGDLMAQLERLSTLKTSGLLTDAEFSAAKGKLLGI